MHLRPAAPDRPSRLELVAAPRQVRLLAVLTLTGRLGGRAGLSWMIDDNVRPKLRCLPDPADTAVRNRCGSGSLYRSTPGCAPVNVRDDNENKAALSSGHFTGAEIWFDFLYTVIMWPAGRWSILHSDRSRCGPSNWDRLEASSYRLPFATICFGEHGGVLQDSKRVEQHEPSRCQFTRHGLTCMTALDGRRHHRTSM
jgi:hypothetical protein